MIGWSKLLLTAVVGEIQAGMTTNDFMTPEEMKQVREMCEPPYSDWRVSAEQLENMAAGNFLYMHYGGIQWTKKHFQELLNGVHDSYEYLFYFVSKICDLKKTLWNFGKYLDEDENEKITEFCKSKEEPLDYPTTVHGVETREPEDLASSTVVLTDQSLKEAEMLVSEGTAKALEVLSEQYVYWKLLYKERLARMKNEQRIAGAHVVNSSRPLFQQDWYKS